MTEAPQKHRTDGEATRVRILETAGELFAAAGYAETTSKSIADRAEVSLASINYHFGGRAGLYRAVLIEAHRRVIDVADLSRLAGSELSSPAKLGVLIDELVGRATRRQLRWPLHVLAKEMFAPSAHIHDLMQSEVPPKLSIIQQILSEITAIPPGDPALVRCIISVVAPCTLLLLAGRGVPGPLDDIRRMPREVITTHLHRFALAGLEAIGREHRRRDDAVGESSRVSKRGRRQPTGRTKG